MPPLRAFISYSNQDKLIGGQVKNVLRELEIEAFLAHDDIRVSEEWKERILEELRQADIFVPLLSQAFMASHWTLQELGFITARPEVLVIPLMLDSTIPFGFISQLQGDRYSSSTITQEFFIEPIKVRFPRYIIPLLIGRLAGAGSFRRAESLMQPLIPLFAQFDDSEIDQFVDVSIGNGQIWDAHLCKTEYIPQFIEMHHRRINGAKMKELAKLIKVP